MESKPLEGAGVIVPGLIEQLKARVNLESAALEAPRGRSAPKHTSKQVMLALKFRFRNTPRPRGTRNPGGATRNLATSRRLQRTPWGRRAR
eukprot:9333372-Alexandrium_andersonii.AAC.1